MHMYTCILYTCACTHAHAHARAHAITRSGGITLETMPSFFGPAVDIISQGALTNGYDTLDFSLKVLIRLTLIPPPSSFDSPPSLLIPHATSLISHPTSLSLLSPSSFIPDPRSLIPDP